MEYCTSRCLHNRLHNCSHRDAGTIFFAALQAVNASDLIKNVVKRDSKCLQICERHYDKDMKCYIVGFGKTVFNMAVTLESILGEQLVKGICSVPIGAVASEKYRKSSIKFMEGAKDNFPDADAEKATKEIIELVTSLTKDDLLIILITGGGSALLPLATEPITNQEKYDIVKQLMRSGANTMELNIVRKRLSQVKGGGLARLAFPARVVALLVSNVVDDKIDYIASGPTVPNLDSPRLAINILRTYKMYDDLPFTVKDVLSKPAESSDDCLCVPLNPLGKYVHVENCIIGNNRMALKRATTEALQLGYSTVITSHRVQGEVWKISKAYANLGVEIAVQMKERRNPEHFRDNLIQLQSILHFSDEAVEELVSLDYTNPKGVCIIAGGESTIRVQCNGKGGRNQHLALRFSIDVSKLQKERTKLNDMNITLLSCATDGIDGPTNAAGAIGSTIVYDEAIAANVDPNRYYRNWDSHGFFSHYNTGSNMIRLGQPGTDVMDIHVLIVKITPCT